MKVLLLFLVVGVALACESHQDCKICQECDAKGKCINVTPMTDPNHDCPIVCGVQLVCGSDPHCVINEAPTCECDWKSGLCVDEEEKSGDEETVIDVIIEEDEEPHKNKKVLHPFGVAFLAIAGMAMLGLFGVFLTTLRRISDPPAEKKETGILPKEISQARRKRKERTSRTGPFRSGALMTEVPLTQDEEILFVSARCGTDSDE